MLSNKRPGVKIFGRETLKATQHCPMCNGSRSPSMFYVTNMNMNRNGAAYACGSYWWFSLHPPQQWAFEPCPNVPKPPLPADRVELC